MNCASGVCSSVALLLDTHAVLWWFDRHLGTLSQAAQAAITRTEEPLRVSSVTGFEIATKHASGKLDGVGPLLAGFEQKLVNERFTPMPVEMRHAVAVAGLPLHHRDPFDRLLIAQALIEDLTIVSMDAAFDRYGVRRLW